jgi:hypothetical protein
MTSTGERSGGTVLVPDRYMLGENAWMTVAARGMAVSAMSGESDQIDSGLRPEHGRDAHATWVRTTGGVHV